jgi:hypothetical protein
MPLPDQRKERLDRRTIVKAKAARGICVSFAKASSGLGYLPRVPTSSLRGCFATFAILALPVGAVGRFFQT